MVSEIDIYRSAKMLIDQHGEDAGLEAAMRADAMLEKGDLDGKRAWLRIMKAVDELQRQDRRPGETGAKSAFFQKNRSRRQGRQSASPRPKF